MEILESSFSCKKMVKVSSGMECGFGTNQILNIFLWDTIEINEVRKETKHSCLFLSFFWKTVDQLDNFLDKTVEVVSQQKLTILEHFWY